MMLMEILVKKLKAIGKMPFEDFVNYRDIFFLKNKYIPFIM